LTDQEYRDLVYKKIRGIVNEPENDLRLVSDLLRDTDYDVNENVNSNISDHGIEEDDADFYGEDIEDIITSLEV